MDDYRADPNRYGTMKYNRLGASGVLTSALSLGFWHNFGGEGNFETGRAMVRRAFDLGITHFDLANNYGVPAGSAEEAFGRILAADMKPHRDEMFISTKAGHAMWPGPYGDWGSKKHLLASLDQSLRRMGLEYVDVFYSHRPDPETPLEETMDALATVVKSGRALYVGLSKYDTDLTRRAVRLLREMGVRCLTHQCRYSMLSRGPEAGLLQAAQELGIGVVAFSPLAQGLLSDKYLHGIPEDSRAVRDGRFLKPAQITDEKVSMLLKLNGIAASRGQSLTQMALAWALRGGRVQSCIIGASRPAQIEENVRALENLAFSEEELRLIGEVVEGS